jgi:DNA replication protein DnaC
MDRAELERENKRLLALREAARRKNTMDSISENTGVHTFPDRIFEKYATEVPPRASTDPADLVHVCEVHGELVMPARVPQGFIKVSCRLCHEERVIAEGRRAQRRKDALERERRAQKLYTPATCFAWLGEDFSEPGLDQLTFENFDLMRIKPIYRREIGYVLAWAKQFAESPQGNVILYGSYGVGKTHIVAAILNALRAGGRYDLHYTTAPNLHNAIEDRRTNRSDVQEISTSLTRASVVVIDEVDKVKLTEGRRTFYMNLVNKRSNKERVDPGSAVTILICNTAVQKNAYELEPWIGVEAASRLNIGLKMIYVPGEDFRLNFISR